MMGGRRPGFDFSVFGAIKRLTVHGGPITPDDENRGVGEADASFVAMNAVLPVRYLCEGSHRSRHRPQTDMLDAAPNTLDRARDFFEAYPAPATAELYGRMAASYRNDGMISAETYDAIPPQVRPHLAV